MGTLDSSAVVETCPHAVCCEWNDLPMQGSPTWKCSTGGGHFSEESINYNNYQSVVEK